MKACNRCKKVKPYTDFSLARKNKDGYKSVCKQCEKEYFAQWYRDNREHDKKQSVQWRKNNKEHQSQYHIANRDRRNKYAAQWKRDNPDIVTAQHAKRRAWKKNAVGNYSGKEWAALKKLCDYKCLCCGRYCDDNIKGQRLTHDHIVPLSCGGTNWISNIQPLCRSCNNSKHVDTTDYRPQWMKDAYTRGTAIYLPNTT